MSISFKTWKKRRFFQLSPGSKIRPQNWSSPGSTGLKCGEPELEYFSFAPSLVQLKPQLTRPSIRLPLTLFTRQKISHTWTTQSNSFFTAKLSWTVFLTKIKSESVQKLFSLFLASLWKRKKLFMQIFHDLSSGFWNSFPGLGISSLNRDLHFSLANKNWNVLSASHLFHPWKMPKQETWLILNFSQ